MGNVKIKVSALVAKNTDELEVTSPINAIVGTIKEPGKNKEKKQNIRD